MQILLDNNSATLRPITSNKQYHQRRFCSMATRQKYTFNGRWELTVEETSPDDNGKKNVGEKQKEADSNRR